MNRTARITYTTGFDYYGRGNVRLQMGSKHIKLVSDGRNVGIYVDGSLVSMQYDARVKQPDGKYRPNPVGHAHALAVFVLNCVNTEGEEGDLLRRDCYDFLNDGLECDWHVEGVKSIEALAFKRG